ncbi:hypothetical protein D9M68_866440 [compost metagenome]
MAVIVSIAGFFCSLFPFGQLVGFIFPASGWLGIAYVCLIIARAVKNSRSRTQASYRIASAME